MLRGWKPCFVSALVLYFLACSSPSFAAKNVVLMVADGAGWNTWAAAAMYQGKLGKEVYDAKGWVKYGVVTYPKDRVGIPSRAALKNPRPLYDAVKYWDATPTPLPVAADKPVKPATVGLFAGYDYARGAATDSAAAASALASGRKTYNGVLNMSDNGRKLVGLTIAEVAKRAGKSCGVITSVPWSHATPAGLGGAHNNGRNEYAQIAREMLDSGTLDVVMGAGHPDYDENGRQYDPAPKKVNYNYVGGEEAWKALVEGTYPGGWKLVQTRAEFEALASGDTPKRVVGTAQAASTLQANRSRPKPADANAPPAVFQPFEVPLNQTVPSLKTMTCGALNCLDDNPNGFFLMIEGGAVDWANHGNDETRMIEEFSDYVASVEAVCDWVEKNSSWDDTLLILTADHDTGLPWGPDSQTTSFQPLEDNGPGKLPGLRYHTGGHSNSLVPVYARGAGSEQFAQRVCGIDRRAGKAWGFSGRYLQNTDIYFVMESEVLVPEAPKSKPDDETGANIPAAVKTPAAVEPK